MKYIDADSLLAELDTKRKDCLIAHNEFRTDDPELASFYEGKAKACAELSYYINSLKQEQPSLPSNLDEAAEKYAIQGHENHTNVNYINTYIEGKRIGFIAGAEWQKEQDDKLVDIIYQQGIEKGRDEMRETLKKNEK